MSEKVHKLIRTAYNNPEKRDKLLPVIKKARQKLSDDDEPDWLDKKVKNPETGSKVKVKTLKSKPEDSKAYEKYKKIKEQQKDDDDGGEKDYETDEDGLPTYEDWDDAVKSMDEDETLDLIENMGGSTIDDVARDAIEKNITDKVEDMDKDETKEVAKTIQQVSDSATEFTDEEIEEFYENPATDTKHFWEVQVSEAINSSSAEEDGPGDLFEKAGDIFDELDIDVEDVKEDLIA